LGHDENTLGLSGGKSDPYLVFQRMLERGQPPDDWASLMDASQTTYKDI
jgi:toxin YhaV